MDPSGQLDMQQLLAAAQQMQSQLLNAQQELAESEVEGNAGGGLVTAVVNGQGELVDLEISAEAIDTGDPEETSQTIADLVLAAVRDAYEAASELQQQKMGPFAAGFGGAGDLGLPAMPGLAGMPGAVGDPGYDAEDEAAEDEDAEDDDAEDDDADADADDADADDADADDADADDEQ